MAGTSPSFLNRNPAYADAAEPVMAWYRQLKAADWATPAEVKRDVRSASILKDGRVVFNISGNKYRIVVWINYAYRVVYIRFIGTIIGNIYIGRTNMRLPLISER